MAAVHDSLMTTEEFEELARVAGRVSEGLRLEYIDGKLGAKAVPDGDHDRIMQWLTRILLMMRPELWLWPERGLKVEGYRAGRARPGGVLAGAEAFVGQGEWADPRPVLMVVEITSRDEDIDRRDRTRRSHAYAQTGIPVYLLIERESSQVLVHSKPYGTEYEQVLTASFGAVVELPDPVGVTFETESIKDWVC